MYVLKTPRGRLVEQTVAAHRSDCWSASYGYIASIEPLWGLDYWKKWEASQASARKMGYRIVKCKLVEMNK